MRIDPRYFRPAEVETLLGDPTKAKGNWAGCPRSPRKRCAPRWWPTICKAHAATPVAEHGLDLPIRMEGLRGV